MFDAAKARRMMVDGQVRTADVTNLELIAAMLAVPRELFVPAPLSALAYSDGDLVIAPGRSLLRPMVLAKLLQAADIKREDRVLDVGCGTGYAAAILARMVGSVVALEENTDLAQQAKAALPAAGAAGVTVTVGPLMKGWAGAGPYDFILLEGATEIPPDALGRQLNSDGRLLCIFGRAPAAKAMIYREIEGRMIGRPIFDAAAAILPGFVAPPEFVF